jgi:hypothetical protein
VIKAGTSGTDVPIKRLFITGVSPITMDDVTSGFNIGKNISIDRTFNEMMGFREQEVIEKKGAGKKTVSRGMISSSHGTFPFKQQQF